MNPMFALISIVVAILAIVFAWRVAEYSVWAFRIAIILAATATVFTIVFVITHIGGS